MPASQTWRAHFAETVAHFGLGGGKATLERRLTLVDAFLRRAAFSRAR
jgi:hypothetical protein